MSGRPKLAVTAGRKRPIYCLTLDPAFVARLDVIATCLGMPRVRIIETFMTHANLDGRCHCDVCHAVASANEGRRS